MSALPSAPLRCAAVDDEPLALDILRAHAAHVPFLGPLATFVSATEALAYLHTAPADVLFLDVEMPDVSGLEVAELAAGAPKIIFTTAHPRFAVQGFELAATDFLLKPIGFGRFLQACTRAHQQLAAAGAGPPAAAVPPGLFVKDGYTWVRIDATRLLYLEAADNYCTFYELGRRTVARLTLAAALARLPAGQFLRVHKSYAVALAHVEKITRHQATVGGQAVPLSASGHSELLRSLDARA